MKTEKILKYRNEEKFMGAETEIQKIQKANLFILKEVDRICRKYKIHYLLDAGTLIGAVRHKGFIPWDDDVDIAFLRKDYEKFIEAAKKELPKGLHIWFPTDAAQDNAFYDFTPKIIYEKSRKVLENQETAFYREELNHICVDLFILDEITENIIGQKLQILWNKIIYGMAMGHRWHLDFGKYKGVQKLQVKLLAAIGKCISMKTICRWEKGAALRQSSGKSRILYYSNYQPDYVHMTVPKKGSKQVIEMEFEGEKFMVPKGYDRVLKVVYGDYMTPPPPEKRVPTHGNLEAEGFWVELIEKKDNKS